MRIEIEVRRDLGDSYSAYYVNAPGGERYLSNHSWSPGVAASRAIDDIADDVGDGAIENPDGLEIVIRYAAGVADK